MQKITLTFLTLLSMTFVFGQKASQNGPILNAASINIAGLEKVQTTVCDTVTNIDGSNDTLTFYTVAAANGGGYVSGHNGYGDVAKAEYFNYTGAPATIPGVAITFAIGKAGQPAIRLT